MDFTAIQFNQMRHEEMRQLAEERLCIASHANIEATPPFYATALVRIGKTLSSAGAALQETYGQEREPVAQRPSNV